ncbi:transport protein Avl9-domain-containing protein [Protomyces lactucae-debilis]|uniref:Transport protein Avl9-domain-containing protein n=1 Tax=Protomyces lactucae-debilis TaxID=2754530 RepID=A0A1Y2FS69_PROLT|nr:transport protein Avl9-domain-containing protein [Protomyces lactucae-debilis]ORY86851.1 transport protein Avl9-domain-containing protein [Protomyces lactucae-debilis]
MAASPILNVLVVDFHHARGPEIEYCFPQVEDADRPKSWDILSFQALPDGSHLHDEDYSYFTVITGDADIPTAFGISCNRQLKSDTLLRKKEDVTRSTIQKAIVVLTSTPHVFSHIKDKLGAVTRAFFAQRDFDDCEILRGFYDSLVARLKAGHADEDALYTGMPVRQLIHDFKWKVLVMLKALLLERRILYFGTNIEQLCTVQYSVLSLVPGLLENLKYCGDPSLSEPEDGTRQRKHETVRSSDRKSMLRYMGMPLQPFSKGAFFGPYTPLQQVDLLEDPDTRSYMIGSSNSLFLHAKERHCDVLINVDTKTIELLDPTLRPALALSGADRKWADAVVQLVEEAWDPSFPDMPSTRTFSGSEEDIRNLFERYIFALCAVDKYNTYTQRRNKPNDGARSPSPEALLDIEHEIQLKDYGTLFLEHWRKTENYRLWSTACDDECFDIAEPRHPVLERDLTLADVQQRLVTAVGELKLDERTAQTRQAIKSTLAHGSVKVGKFWQENMEALQRRTAATASAPPELKEGSLTEKAADNAPPPLLQMPTQEIQVAKTYLSGFKSRWQRAFTGTSANSTTVEGSSTTTAPQVSKQSLDLPPTPDMIDSLPAGRVGGMRGSMPVQVDMSLLVADTNQRPSSSPAVVSHAPAASCVKMEGARPDEPATEAAQTVKDAPTSIAGLEQLREGQN